MSITKRGKQVALKVIFDFGDSTSTCSTKITLTKSSGYTMIAGGFVVLGLAGVLTRVGRRRRTGTIQLDAQEGTASHFEMMPNEGAARV